MPKKSDGKQGKNGKSSKDGKNGVKKNPAATPSVPKVIKTKGPKPDYNKKPHAKTNETFQTLESARNGFHGLVSVDGMRLRFFAETSEAGEKTNRARLVSAPIKTALSDLGDYTTSIKLESLKDSSFVSDFEKGDPRYEVQAKLWMFLVHAFSNAGFKLAHNKKPDVPTASPAPKAVEHKHENKASASVADFVSGKLGLYRFEVSGPYAVISIEHIEDVVRAPQFGNTAMAHLKIKLVLVGKGHQLAGCKLGTFLYYGDGTFKGIPPVFKGPSAKDCGKLYAYLANVRSLYRRSLRDKTLVPAEASQGGVVGEKVITRAQNNVLLAA